MSEAATIPKDARGILQAHGAHALRDAATNAKPFEAEPQPQAENKATPEPQPQGKPSIRERAYALRFDPNEAPPPDESCMMIGDIPIAARGNLTATQGKSKVGKSAVVSAILGAAHRGEYQTQGDTLCVSWVGESTGAIIHLDTEQSRADSNHGRTCSNCIRKISGHSRTERIPL